MGCWSTCCCSYDALNNSMPSQPISPATSSETCMTRTRTRIQSPHDPPGKGRPHHCSTCSLQFDAMWGRMQMSSSEGASFTPAPTATPLKNPKIKAVQPLHKCAYTSCAYNIARDADKPMLDGKCVADIYYSQLCARPQPHVRIRLAIASLACLRRPASCSSTL